MQHLPEPLSITHLHLLSVINTLVSHDFANQPIRLLDAGCGNGRLISYLHRCLHQLHPDKTFHISGFDVSDHGVQTEGFLRETVDRLNKEIPEVDWSTRIHSVQANEQWKFCSEGYSLIVSNQVLEHVQDKDAFFYNISRNLLPNGYTIHLAPLKHIIHEGHIYLPWAHRIDNYSALFSYIKILSRLGFGKFREHKRNVGCSLDSYAERHADYMYFWTRYATERETIQFARRNGLRADFRFSADFYKAKIRQILRRPSKYLYEHNDSGIKDAASIKLLRYISSVTLVCKKMNTY